MVDSLKVDPLSVWRPLTVSQSKSCSWHGVCKGERCLEIRYLVDYLNIKLCRMQAVRLLGHIELLLALLRGLVSMTKYQKLPFLLRTMITTRLLNWSVVTLSPYTGPSEYTEIEDVL